MAVLWNTTNDSILATRVERLDAFWRRGVGLLSRSALHPDEGVWLPSCRAIHTIGMRFTIDVVFVDRAGCIVRTCRNVAPNQLAIGCARADAVVELAAGTIDAFELQLGTHVALVAALNSATRPDDRAPR